MVQTRDLITVRGDVTYINDVGMAKFFLSKLVTNCIEADTDNMTKVDVQSIDKGDTEKSKSKSKLLRTNLDELSAEADSHTGMKDVNTGNLLTPGSNPRKK